MSEHNKWYVYMHTNKINNKKYIGITGQQKYWMRWGSEGCRYKSQVFGKAIEKYGWDNFNHEILKEVGTKEQAYELERFYIQKYKSNDKEFGYNVTAGGESISGLYNLPSMSVPVYQYDLDGNFLAEYPSMMEAERVTGIDNSAICACCKGVHHYTKKYIWSYIRYDKIQGIDPKEMRYELIIKKQEKKVYQYNLDGLFIMQYKSLTEASQATKVDYRDISDCCINSNRKQAGGYIWSYSYSDQVAPYCRHTGRKKIYQYSKQGVLINVYNGYKEVVDKYNIKQSELYRACRKTRNDDYKILAGYIWSYDELTCSASEIVQKLIDSENKKLRITKYRRSKYDSFKIYQYDKAGNLLYGYDNINCAINSLNLNYKAKHSIIACCLGKSKTSYGFQWSFDLKNMTNNVRILKSEMPIYKLDRDGNIISLYDNAIEASRGYPSLPSESVIRNIILCAKGDLKTYQGYIWIFKDELSELNVANRQKSYKKKTVSQYDLNGHFIQTFESIAEANKYLGIKDSHISSCCSGKRKTSNGYIWKYSS